MTKNLLVLSLIFCVSFVSAQDLTEIKKDIKSIKNNMEYNGHTYDVMIKKIDDLLWFERVGDIAHVDKLYIYGPPNANVPNPTAMGANNPVKFWTYVFIPKDIDVNKKYPLMVLPHGGVHSNFGTYYTHIVRELVSQGYVVVAAEYRGSTGYGKGMYEKIDYGGLEVADVKASRDYMIENYEFVDAKRVGIMGWSHGGLITLHNIFDYPNDFQVAFAGVPVSDLIARMGYHNKGYLDLYSADYHIGKTVNQDVEEYKRRSPAWQAHKLQNTPLLIHTNTIDDDVNVLEVEHLIKSLKAEGKKFEYEIYQAVPGGHSFDRMDTKIAKEIRVKIYKFMAKQLNPPKPITTVKKLHKAAYVY